MPGNHDRLSFCRPEGQNFVDTIPPDGTGLDQFGRSCGREERLSLNETLSSVGTGRSIPSSVLPNLSR